MKNQGMMINDNKTCAGDISFIEVQSNPRKRRWLKVMSFFVAFVFFVQQIAFSLDLASFKALSISYPISMAGIGTQMQKIDETKISEQPEKEITNYDMLSYRRRQSGLSSLLPDAREQEGSAAYTPYYLKRQQSKHEELIRQKQETEDLRLLINMDAAGRSKPKSDQDDDVPLKKKGGASPGGIYYTLENYDNNGSPCQLNVYKYAGGDAIGRCLEELITYDVSGLNTGEWTSHAKRVTPKDSDPFIGSYVPLQNEAILTEDRIISRTVYNGRKGDERVSYVYSSYSEDNLPEKVTTYCYDADGDDGLDETRTYNIANLDIDVDLDSDWKSKLTEDRLIGKTFYDGSEGKEKILYVLDGYFLEENGENTPSSVSIYDYDKVSGDELDEVRDYNIVDVSEDAWLCGEEKRLKSRTVYSGEKDKEKISYVFSNYENEDGKNIPKERKDYFYEGDKLVETKTYDSSHLSEAQMDTAGMGVLEEDTFFTREKGHEKMAYSYGSYDENNVPFQRKDYVYDNRLLKRVDTYDVSKTNLDSKDFLKEQEIYEGKAEAEKLKRNMCYSENGVMWRVTTYEYGENEKGIDFVRQTEEIMCSDEGEIIGRVETANDLYYVDADGVKREDQNGSIRNQIIKNFCIFQGKEIADSEERISFLSYTAKREVEKEKREIYVYDGQNGLMSKVELQEISSSQFNSKGVAGKQIINFFTFDSSGLEIYGGTKEIENNQFDYFGNVLDRAETVWTSVDDRSDSSLKYQRRILSSFDNRMASRKGNAACVEVTRYSSLEETEQYKIDRTVTFNTSFDLIGNILEQEIYGYANEKEDLSNEELGERLVSIRKVHNSGINPRGDIFLQEITAYQVDADEHGIQKETLQTHQVIVNREYDTKHNAVSQTVYTYDQADTEKRLLLEVQEVRFIGFYSSGIAAEQTVATYSDEAKTNLLDAKVVKNKRVDIDGNVYLTGIDRYRAVEITNAGEENVGIICKGEVDRQMVSTEEYDIRGNALKQTIEREYYEDGEYKFCEKQEIENKVFDIHERVRESEVRNFSRDEETKEEILIDTQVIKCKEYDRFGNGLRQEIDTYSTLLVLEETLIDHKVITNEYKDEVTRKRGTVSKSEVVRYRDKEESVEIDKTVTETLGYNALGNALEQATNTYISREGEFILASRREVINEGFNTRGDAVRQEITTYNIDGEDETLVMYQVIENREYGIRHNALNQKIQTYDERDGLLLDIQEIRSRDFTSSGVAGTQVIATYTDKWEILDAKEIENRDIDLRGNVSEMIVTKYTACGIAGEGKDGEITIDERTGVERTITKTDYDNFDVRGNALEQTVE
ncbi:MAG: hypothetical protein ABH844_06995, partial [Candidatus Omnitrophota bacterium]